MGKWRTPPSTNKWEYRPFFHYRFILFGTMTLGAKGIEDHFILLLLFSVVTIHRVGSKSMCQYNKTIDLLLIGLTIH